MKKQIEALKQKRAALIAEARTVNEQLVAAVEKNEPVSDFRAKIEKIEADIKTAEDTIRGLERQMELERSLEAAPDREGTQQTEQTGRASDDYRTAFIAYTRNRASAEQVRALQVGDDTEGGYLAPEQFENNLFVALADAVAMRKICFVTRASGDRKIPMVTTKPTFAYMAEEGTYGTAEVKFGAKTIGAYKAGGIILVSEELLQDAVTDVEALLRSLCVEAMAVLEEGKYVDGTGVGEPTGLLQTATVGKTGASATDVTFDELLDLVYSLKAGYRSNGRWLMKDSSALALRKKKDGNGQYIWQPSVLAGEPDRLLSYPISYSDSMPAIATTKKPFAFGDFKGYRIVDRMGFEFRRLNELYAASGQVGFRITYRNDGKLLDTDAVKVFQNA